MNELVHSLVSRSLSAGWLVLAVLVLRMLLRRAPRWVFPALWGLVALRLVMPFSIQSQFSLIPASKPLSSPAMVAGTPTVSPLIPNLELPETVDAQLHTSELALQVETNFFPLLWIVGLTLMLLYAAFSWFRIHRHLATAVRLREGVYASEWVETPFIFGIFRPKIYLPFGLSSEEQELILAHEQAHLHRCDHWWKPLAFLLLSIYWFNPLLWLADFLLDRDIELACDERVIRTLGAQARIDYSQALLNCSVHRRSITLCPLAFGEVGVKERVKKVLKYNKPALLVTILSILAGLATAFCFLTDPLMVRFDFAENRIAEAYVQDFDTETEPQTLNKAQMEELESRLESLKFQMAKDDRMIPDVGLTFLLENGRAYSIHWDMEKSAQIQIEGKFYTIQNKEFLSYLDNLSTGGDTVKAAPAAEKWLDTREEPASIRKSAETTLSEFPNVQFRWTPDEVIVVDDQGETTQLYEGMPVWDVYFADLNGDGFREICSTVSVGSGIIDDRIVVVDYALGQCYEQSARMEYDYHLIERNGGLWVEQCGYAQGEWIKDFPLSMEELTPGNTLSGGVA